jgi:hypothetical protein
MTAIMQNNIFLCKAMEHSAHLMSCQHCCAFGKQSVYYLQSDFFGVKLIPLS